MILKPSVLAFLFFMLGFKPTMQAQLIQQGNKLGASDEAGAGNLGWAVSIAADGNTAIAGALRDDNITGAAFIYTLSNGGVWSQQGNKLVGSGASGQAAQGAAVAISADGNTAIVGGRSDNGYIGAAWIFVRSLGVWSQQGSKLVGSGASGQSAQGAAVAISANGNTAIVGGLYDNSGDGAFWIFTRSGTTWTQQGSKITTGAENLGASVSIAADGNTALIGAPFSNNGSGGAYIYTLNAGAWTQGSLLTGTGGTGDEGQGSSVSLSGDGKTAIIGGPYDDQDFSNSQSTFKGAVWIFALSGGVWAQQGSKITANDANSDAEQGGSVSLSYDGNTAMVGGSGDNRKVGATWIYTRTNGVWTQRGNKFIGSGGNGRQSQGASVSLSSNGRSAIIGAPADNNGVGSLFTATESSLLAVDFISINAKNTNGQVLINWKVASEIDILRYEIERSSDGISFLKIGEVASKRGTDYSFTDVQTLNGNCYYRVKSVANTGQTKYTAIVVTNSLAKSGTFILLPNPIVGNLLKVQFKDQLKGAYDLQLIDAAGKLIFSTKVFHTGENTNHSINLPARTISGVYKLKIISFDKKISLQQLIINQ